MIPRFIVFIAFAVSFIGFLKIRRENSVDHIELVLQRAVLFLEDPDSIEQFLLGRHDSIVMYWSQWDSRCGLMPPPISHGRRERTNIAPWERL